MRRMWTRPIFSKENRLLYGCGNNLFEGLKEDSSKFFNYFRMNSDMFFELLNIVNSKIEKMCVVRSPIESKIRLAITLRYLAFGDSMKSMSYAFRVAPQTVSEIISETCSAIWECLGDKVLRKPTTKDWKAIANDFERKWNFPHCIGAVDGKHIVIQVC